MRLVAIASMVLALGGGFALAAEPAATAPAPAKAAAPAAAPALDDKHKLVEAGTQFMLGKFDESLEAARGLMRSAVEDAVKTGATRLAAECLRKKSEWKAAASVYVALRDRFEKGSADWLKYDATAEILQASPTGVYPPLEAAMTGTSVKPAAGGDSGTIGPVGPAPVAAATPPPADKPAVNNLTDDAYLARALALLGGTRMEKLRGRIAGIVKARTPQDTEAAFAALAEDIKQARPLAEAAVADALEQSAAHAAARRLAELGKQVTPTLNGKLADYLAAARSNALMTTQKKEMTDLQMLCGAMADAEGEFQAVMGKMAGLRQADDAAELRSDSGRRQAEYERLARTFGFGSRDRGARWDGGGAGGRGGGGRGAGRGR